MKGSLLLVTAGVAAVAAGAWLIRWWALLAVAIAAAVAGLVRWAMGGGISE